MPFIHPPLREFCERTGDLIGPGPFCHLDSTCTPQQLADAYRHAAGAAYRYACDSDATGEYHAENVWQEFYRLQGVADEAQRLADIAQGRR